MDLDQNKQVYVEESAMELGTPPDGIGNNDASGNADHHNGDEEEDGVYLRDVTGFEKLSTEISGDFVIVNWINTQKGNIIK